MMSRDKDRTLNESTNLMVRINDNPENRAGQYATFCDSRNAG